MKKIFIVFVLLSIFLFGCSSSIYTVTFEDGNGNIIEKKDVKGGDSVTAPEITSPEGYVFKGWDTDLTIVKDDVVVKPKFERKECTVVFLDGFGVELKKVKVLYGDTVTAPEVIAPEGLVFNNWSLDFNEIKTDLTITAEYKVPSFVVSFLNVNDELIKSELVEYGKGANPPEAPLVIGKEFTKWDNDYTNITEDLTVKPIYTDKEYEVKFVDYNDNVLEVFKVKHGESVIPPVATRTGYTFISWDKDYSSITSDTIIKAQYEVNKYEVEFYYLNENNDEVLLKKETIEYGNSANEPIIDNRPGYRFLSWNTDFSVVTSDLRIMAIYESITYKVIFMDYDDSIIETVSTKYGTSATAPSNPVREGYNFNGWDKEFDNVNSDLTIKATYVIIKYTITYYDDTKELKLYPSKYDCETLVFLPETTKEGYTFLGWYTSQSSTEKIVSLSIGEVGNKVFYAKWEKNIDVKITLPEGKFYFTKINKVAQSSGNGTYVYQPSFSNLSFPTPYTLPSTSTQQYDWTSSDTDIATISSWSSITGVKSGYAIITATYKTDPSITGHIIIKVTPEGIFASNEEEANKKVYYTVTFKDDTGNIIDTKEVIENGTVDYPTPPKKDGYYFFGWDKQNYNITSNQTINATYKAGSLSYEGKTVSILGDSISTYKGYIPTGYSHFYPYPTADIGDVNQTWWMMITNKFGMSLLKNNSWSGSCVASGTGNSGATNDSRLIQLLDGNTKPDVIIIFMGANDCGSKYVSLKSFTDSYKVMLDKIKVLCPDSKLIICTLAPSGLYTESDRIEYNKVIRDYANTYNALLCDFETLYTQSEYKAYVVDSIHPNYAGMKKYTEKLIETIENN